MRISAKADYAVRAAIELAAAGSERPTKGDTVAQAQGIPLKFLENILADMRHAGLVTSRRGAEGGYWLARPAEEITVADIIVAVDEPIDATGCAGKENCMGEDAGRCMTHDLWASLNSKMIEFLDSVSLKKLVDEQLAKGVSIEEHPVKRAISTQPVVKPIKITAPNSVFALGAAFSK